LVYFDLGLKGSLRVLFGIIVKIMRIEYGVNMNIRLATLSDATTLLAIYAPYVENTAITFEYEVPTIEDFANRIEKHWKNILI